MQRKNETAIHLTDYKPSAYLIDKTDIHFDLDEKNTIVHSTLDVRKNPDVKGGVNQLVLNGENIALDSVAINGKPLSSDQYKVTSSTLTIKDVPRAFKLQIQNHLNPEANPTQTGLYITKGVLCSLCEAENFRKMTFFLDRPDVLSSFKTTLVADQKKFPTLLSNGIMTSKGKRKNGKHWVTWSDPIRKPSYLFVLVGGKFDIAEDKYVTKSGREIKIQIYVEKGKADQCGLAMDALKKAMRWDEETYGREYDLNCYKIVAVNDFDASADENTGINIFKADCLLGTPANTEEHSLAWIHSTVPHEFFHHWSGNRVTIRDWFQISLKEGLTTFREQSFNEDALSPVCRLDSVKSAEYQFASDGYPVQPASFKKYSKFQEDAVSSIYSKGAEIFRMLETYLGKPTYRKATSVYFDRYKGKAATFENYLETLEEISHKDLSQFLLWFRQAGTPVLRVSDHYNAKTKTYTLKLDQACTEMSELIAKSLNITSGDLAKTKPLPIPVRLELLDKKGSVMPLYLGSDKPEKEKVLMLTDNKAEFTFKNVRERPVLSLLRGFSAPVILEHQQKMEDLRVLLKYDSDIYNRHRAGKEYVKQTLLDMINQYHENETCSVPEDFIQTFRFLLKSKTIDNRLLANILQVPAELSLLSLVEAKEDLDSIHQAREIFFTEMGARLKEEFKNLLEKTDTDDAADLAIDPGLRKSLGKRQLHNACSYYLMRNKDLMLQNHLIERFDKTLSTNLTDNIAALQMLVDLGGKNAKTALDQFYDKWKNDREKINIWIQAQAASQAPEMVKNLRNLLDDNRFDITQERQAFTLMYTYMANIAKCYSDTEESYKFIAELYKRLKEAKSILAKELVTVLNGWSKLFEGDRKEFFDKYLGDIVKDKVANQADDQSEDQSVGADQTEELLSAIASNQNEVEELAEEAREATEAENAEEEESEESEESDELEESEDSEESDELEESEDSEESDELEESEESEESEELEESEKAGKSEQADQSEEAGEPEETEKLENKKHSEEIEEAEEKEEQPRNSLNEEENEPEADGEEENEAKESAEEEDEAEEATEEELMAEVQAADEALAKEAKEAELAAEKEEEVEEEEAEEEEHEDEEQAKETGSESNNAIRAQSDFLSSKNEDQDLGTKSRVIKKDYYSADKLGFKEDQFHLGNKTNRQIHLLLSKQGIFNKQPDLLKKSSEKSCNSDREDYRKFAERLLQRN